MSKLLEKVLAQWPLNRAQFLGCIATHNVQAKTWFPAEMPGLLGSLQGLRVTFLPTSCERTT